jgi:N-acetylglucosamine kinase-like BadF-type ATPase
MKGAVILGIDAGGSKTRALAGQTDGQVIGAGEAGAANYQSTGQAAAFQALDQAAGRALEAAGASAEQVVSVCLGAAGMDRPEDFAIFQGWAARAFPKARPRLVNDAQIVLAAGTPAGWGLAIISGTGSIAYGRTAQGTTARAGGWGYLLGDEGSGYSIGLRALQAVMRAHDGRDGPTRLTAAVLEAWELVAPEGLVRKVYGGLPRAEVARLAGLVERCAEAGDAAAGEILEWAGKELAATAAAAVKQLRIEGAVPTALTGGVLLHGTRVREALLEAAASMGPRFEPVRLVEDPALGALRLAREALE